MLGRPSNNIKHVGPKLGCVSSTESVLVSRVQGERTGAGTKQKIPDPPKSIKRAGPILGSVSGKESVLDHNLAAS